jgi:hypothetical protein
MITQGVVSNNKPTRADYLFEYFPQYKILLLEDLDLGNRSLTNDIGRVLYEMKIKHPYYAWHDIKIAYKDSMETWDGVNIENKGNSGGVYWYPIRTKDKEVAIEFLKKITEVPPGEKLS